MKGPHRRASPFYVEVPCFSKWEGGESIRDQMINFRQTNCTDASALQAQTSVF